MGQRLDFKLRKISETCLEIIQTLFLHVTSSSKLTGILLPIFSRRSNFMQVLHIWTFLLFLSPKFWIWDFWMFPVLCVGVEERVCGVLIVAAVSLSL